MRRRDEMGERPALAGVVAAVERRRRGQRGGRVADGNIGSAARALRSGR
jgi:hypothetical protein